MVLVSVSIRLDTFVIFIRKKNIFQHRIVFSLK